MTRLFPLVLLAVAACKPGTVDPASVLRPDVRVHHLTLRNIGISGGTVEIALAFHNPNHIKLDGAALGAELAIEGNKFGDVSLEGPFALADQDTTLITVPLGFRWSGLARAARSVLESGAVNYEMKGKFTVTAPVIHTPIDVPFTAQGNVPLLRP